METKNTSTELIRKRYSCRSYTGQPLTKNVIDDLNGLLSKHSQTRFGSTVRLSLLTTESGDNSALKGLGTYGFIKGASAFIVGAVDHSPMNLEDYGYLMELLILHATDLELGTCWLGGSFNKSGFARRISCQEHETVPAVVALGYKADKRRLFDSTVRFIAGSAKRKPFQELFFDRNFSTPLDPALCGPYAQPLEMVRLAPSASNKQPWRVIRDQEKDVYHLFLQRTKNYYDNNHKLFGMADIQRIDMGIAMSHFDVACREAGINGAWTVLKQENSNGIRLPDLTRHVATWRPIHE